MSSDMYAPIYHEPPGADTAIVFIHGLLGSPSFFKPIIAALNPGKCAVSSILLPGHGGNDADFLESNLYQWESAVRRHIFELSKKFRKIILVGHSMGSLLALSNSIYFPAVIGIIAMATPLRIRVRFGALKPETGKEYRRSIFTLRGVPRFLDLFSLIHNTKRTLRRVSVPTLIVHSIGDEVANIGGIGVLEKELGHSEKLTLAHSGHSEFSEPDFRLLTREIRRFVLSLQGRSLELLPAYR